MQALLRRNPDAFFCRRVIVCEGKTEVGILRAFDKYRSSNGDAKFAHYGVGMIPGGGGDQFFQLARTLHECGYDVAILMDSDLDSEEAQKKEMRLIGIPVFDWEEGLAIEEQLFKDVSIECIDAMLEMAIDVKSFEHVKNKLNGKFVSEYKPYMINDETITVVDDITVEDRIKIGTVAKHKKSEWFKNTSMGEMVGDRVFQEFDNMNSCYFKTLMLELQNWVCNHDKR